jgi:glutaconate CoA-transferase subunit A
MKLVSTDEAAGLVENGSTLGVGGVMSQMAPMTVLRAIVARGARDLHAVTVAGGLSIDTLVAGGAANRVSAAFVSFEDLGMAPSFRRRVEQGEVVFEEHTEVTMITRLTAAGSGMPYLPTRAGLGTDMIAALPHAFRVIACPFTGAPVVACAALAPDVAVIHVDRADEEGNAQVAGKHIWHDVVIAKAAVRVIVSAEEIVPNAAVREAPERTILPAFNVDAVVHAPRGAWPLEFPGRYEADRDALRDWIARG